MLMDKGTDVNAPDNYWVSTSIIEKMKKEIIK